MRHWTQYGGPLCLLRYSLKHDGTVYKHDRKVPTGQDGIIAEYRRTKKAIVVEHVGDGEVWTLWFGRKPGQGSWDDISRQYPDPDTAAAAMVMWTYAELAALRDTR